MEQIQKLKQEILTLKLKQPYHPDLQKLLLELDGLLQSAEQDKATSYPKV